MYEVQLYCYRKSNTWIVCLFYLKYLWTNECYLKHISETHQEVYIKNFSTHCLKSQPGGPWGKYQTIPEYFLKDLKYWAPVQVKYNL